jgi:hypothetical protein
MMEGFGSGNRNRLGPRAARRGYSPAHQRAELLISPHVEGEWAVNRAARVSEGNQQ